MQEGNKKRKLKVSKRVRAWCIYQDLVTLLVKWPVPRLLGRGTRCGPRVGSDWPALVDPAEEMEESEFGSPDHGT